MARIVTPLTNTKINAAKPKEKLYKLSDGGGLALWIYPSGKKTWRFEYRRQDKKLDTITFGSYPEISLADARIMREEKRSLVAKNVDPKLADEKENIVTFKTLFELWYERYYETVSPGYAMQMYNIVNYNIMPELGNVDIMTIKPKKIVDTLLPMEIRGSLEQLRKAKRVTGQIFDFAVARGLIEYNPVSSISNKAFKSPVSVNYSALKPDQLNDLINLMYNSNMDLITRNCIMWQLLTLCRPSEATNASWQELDLDHKLWVIPAERMKTNRQHTVPLSSLATDIIKEMYNITGSCHYVFVGRDFKTPINRETPRIALRRFRIHGIDTTSHGLRALGRTYLEESAKWRFEVMESALAHVEANKVVAAYNRADYLEEKREMLEWWGEEVRKYIP